MRYLLFLAVPLVALLLSDLAKEYLYRQGLVREWGIYAGMWTVYGATALVALLARTAGLPPETARPYLLLRMAPPGGWDPNLWQE